MIGRYCVDLVLVTKQAKRVLSKSGQAVFVVGDSKLRNVFVSNSAALEVAACLAGLALLDCQERELPNQNRYLPVPANKSSALGRRMRIETVLTFGHAREGKRGAR